MDRRPKLKTLLRTGITVLLLAAFCLHVPEISLVPSREPYPLDEQTVEDIRALELGLDGDAQATILVPAGEKPRPTEPLPTLPERDESRDATQPTFGSDRGEGNDRGVQGAVESGDAADTAMVLKWYRYGNQEQALSCQSMHSVADTVNLAQLPGGLLRYELVPQGANADMLRDIRVAVSQGDAVAAEQPASGQLTLSIPTGGAGQRYTFRVTAQVRNPDTGQQEQADFTFLLNCVNVPDLNLELSWERSDGTRKTVSCAPGETQRVSLGNGELDNRALRYSAGLTGTLAGDARITEGTYTAASGRVSGSLEPSGTLRLSANLESDRETYYLVYTASAGDRSFVYQFQLDYVETLDVSLTFRWRGRGGTEQSLLCAPGQTAVLPLLTTQLSAGGIGYSLEMSQGRILKVSYASDCTGGGELETSGSLLLTVPQGQTSNGYTLRVEGMVNNRTVSFALQISLCSDAAAQMTFRVAGQTRVLLCENGKTALAQDIYDDELPEGQLEYEFSLSGTDSGGVTLGEIRLYQSAAGQASPLDCSGTVTLAQKDGQRGWNDFTVSARGEGGEAYEFTFRIPYRHRGENTVQIQLNLIDGQAVTNDTDINLKVSAWTQSAQGDITYIPAVGTDTTLLVRLDGREIPYISSSGTGWEYLLHPENPEVGDENTHTLWVYAEDSQGNYGQKELTLRGQRADAGQQVGRTAIYVDMTVLGIGVVGPVYYDVLADEPVSYTVAKVILGMDTGMPFGAARDTFGWQGSYGGTLDVGFYLQSLNTNLHADALESERWPGSSEGEILDAIDGRFGRRTSLASLWRCLYRNGLNKSGGSGTRFGEFDYTSGSGWLYSIGGGAYYPGQSMSQIHLKDGDILTLRYTLAYGWDVGGGTEGYGNSVGYCVTAMNGSFSVNHRYEPVVNGQGTTAYQCRCCGIVEECRHQQLACVDQGYGLHAYSCLECGAALGEPEPHSWSGDADPQSHTCPDCGSTQAHIWHTLEGTDTADCTQGGTASAECVECGAVWELDTAPLGHAWDNRWNFNAQGHFRRCSRCGVESDRGDHAYVYDLDWADFVCILCGAHHDMDFDGCIGQRVLLDATCLELVYECRGCGYYLTQPGMFEEYHRWTQWEAEGTEEAAEFSVCTVCGATQTRW